MEGIRVVVNDAHPRVFRVSEDFHDLDKGESIHLAYPLPVAEAMGRCVEALRFYAERENYLKQLVLAETLGANVPRDCPDKEAHARALCAEIAEVWPGCPIGSDPVLPHDCGLPNGMDDPRVSVSLAHEPRYWGAAPVLKDDGDKARAALKALGEAT